MTDNTDMLELLKLIEDEEAWQFGGATLDKLRSAITALEQPSVCVWMQTDYAIRSFWNTTCEETVEVTPSIKKLLVRAQSCPLCGGKLEAA